MKSKLENRKRRQKRIRAKVKGTAARPRLSVFKSNRSLSVQLIDDDSGRTIASATSAALELKKAGEKAREVGRLIASKALEKKVTVVVFDRGGYRYAGAIKILADGAREGGLTF